MLSQCANSLCSKPFLRLREGRLFLVETGPPTKLGENATPQSIRGRTQQRQVEHYWLCSSCASQFTLIYDREHGVALQPLRRPAASLSAAAGSTQGGVA